MTDAPGSELRDLESGGDYLGLIERLRELVAADRRTLTDPFVKKWCGRRWRWLFLEEALGDAKALGAAGRRLAIPGRDRRAPRQKLAERFLRGDYGDEWAEDMPPAQAGEIAATTLVFCPGLVNTLVPVAAFGAAFQALAEDRGWKIVRADAHPLRGAEANMEDLLAAIERGEGRNPANEPIPEGEATPPGDVFLIGYSKGAVDVLTLLAHHPELRGRVRCVFSWAGAVGGSPVADDIYGRIKDLEIDLGPAGGAFEVVLRTLLPVVNLEGALYRADEIDLKSAVRDLTTGHREEFMAEHGDALDALDIPYFNVTASSSLTEVPYFQAQGYLQLSRLDPDNDMQLTQEQAKITLPMATDLAVLHGHHWDVSYDAFPVRARLGSPNLDHPFPKQAAVAAMFLLAAELGLIH